LNIRKRNPRLPDQIVKTYEEACQAVHHWGILPLSSFIPDHPSLEAITYPGAWHTGLGTDPWLWRDRFASEGAAAYGRFIGGKPLLVSRDLFPLLKCLLSSPDTVEERYEAGTLARSTLRIYELIEENDSIDVRALRKRADMQQKADKNEFDHALIDLQSTADIVIAGISERLNEQGNKSGWNSTCYIVAERWMEQHKLEPLLLSPAEAKARFFAWLEPRWEMNALAYLQKKIRSH
jgi:hypothetical protein